MLLLNGTKPVPESGHQETEPMLTSFGCLTGRKPLPDPMITYLPNIGSSDSLLHDGTKPLPEPIMTYHQLVIYLLCRPIDISNGDHTNGLVQDCGISSANALEIPQSFTKPPLQSTRDIVLPTHIQF